MPRSANWFSGLSKKAQAEYLEAHPNSKYAKGKKVQRFLTADQANMRLAAKEKAAQDSADNKFKKLHPDAINTGDESPVKEALNNIVWAKHQIKLAKDKLTKANSAPAKERARTALAAANKELDECKSDLARAKAKARSAKSK